MAAIAVIGLGAMGSRIAQRLLEAGHELTVWNRTPSRAEPLSAAGAHVARTPGEAAAAAEIAITMLRDPAALFAVTEALDGILSGLRPGAVLVDMSTVGPRAIRELAPRIPSDVGFVDSPVLGSIGEAEEGRLKIFAGGEERLFDRVRPILAALGEPLYVGAL